MNTTPARPPPSDEPEVPLIAWTSILLLGLLLLTPSRAADEFHDRTGRVRTGSGCSGVDCCRSGKLPASCVGRSWQRVLAPDGTIVKRWLVQRDITLPTPKGAGGYASSGGETSLWGLADDDGTVLVKPTYLSMLALTANLAWAERRDGTWTLVRDGKEETSAVRRVESYAVVGGLPVHFAVLPDGIAPVRPDGTLGNTLTGVDSLDGVKVLGSFVVVTVTKDGARASLLFDATGKSFWVGPEVRVHAEWTTFRTEEPRTAASALVGPAPVATDSGDPRLYWPLDGDLRPVDVPGLVGVVPLFSRPDDRKDDDDVTRPRMVSGWLLVFDEGGETTYRIAGRGLAREVVAPARLAALATLDRVEFVRDDPKQPSVGTYVGRRAGTQQWIAWSGGLHPGNIGPYGSAEMLRAHDITTAELDTQHQASPDAAILALRERRRAQNAAQITWEKARDEKARRAAEAAIAARAAADAQKAAEAYARRVENAKTWFDAWVRDARTSVSAHELAEDAALLLGEPYVTRYLAGIDWIEPSHAGWFCVYGEAACATAGRLAAQTVAARVQAEQERAGLEALWRAVELGVRTYDPSAATTVTVQVYEGGRLVTKTMDYTTYGRLYP